MTTTLGRRGRPRVTNIELFFDLVYVYAVTQLSHTLLEHPDAEGALQVALLLGLVWLAWVYTTWVTNWLDPDRGPTRLMLLGLMLASLVMSAALPDAFDERGLAVGVAYAVMQVGRSAYTAWALRGDKRLQRNFERILCWCLVSGTLAVLGGLTHGHARELLWLATITIDLLGGLVGFRTPGLGRSLTTDWTVEAGYFAERFQAFVLIALGESIVVTGSTFAGHTWDGPTVAAFACAFVGAAAFWWIYFDRTAAAGAEAVAQSGDPGRLARSAYHLVHPVMVAGIIVTAAADEVLLDHPTHVASGLLRWLMLGGTALFLAGHALFKATVWHVMPWTRLVAVVLLGALALAAPYISALNLAICTAALVIMVAVSDRVRWSTTG